LDPVLREFFAVVEALGVDAEQYLDAVASALGDLWRRHSCVEPE